MFFLLGGVQMSLLSSLSLWVGVGGRLGICGSSSEDSSSIGVGGMTSLSLLFALICFSLGSVDFGSCWLLLVTIVASSSLSVSSLSGLLVSLSSMFLVLCWNSFVWVVSLIFLMLLRAACLSALVTLSCTYFRLCLHLSSVFMSLLFNLFPQM